eukprot:Nk52_evm106s221 gene=Nk52_evmTU106s221
MTFNIGIDCGSTYSCVAIVKSSDGNNGVSVAETITNEDGFRVTPSFVTHHGEETTVGLVAQQALIRNPRQTIRGTKYMLGMSFDEPSVAKANGRQPCRSEEVNGFPVFNVDLCDEEGNEISKSYTPEDITSKILLKLKETSESYLSDEVSAAVVAVPTYFTTLQKNSYLKALRDADIKVLGMISEPAAAMLAYGIGQTAQGKIEDHNVVVVDVGATCVDVTVVKVLNGMYTVLSSSHNENVGGEVCDKKLFGFFCDEFKRKNRCDLTENKRACSKLMAECERVKRHLSSATNAACHVDSLFEGIDYHTQVPRGRFEMLCQSFFSSCSGTVKSAVEESGLALNEITDVVFSGGASSIPKMRQTVCDLFASATIHSHINPDEVVAQGAAMQADIMAQDEPISQCDEEGYEIEVAAKNVGIALADGKMHCLFTEGTPAPLSRHFDFCVQKDQENAIIRVFEGNNELAEKNDLICEICLNDLSAEEEAVRVRVTASLKENGSLRITAQDFQTGKCVNVVA